MPRRREPVVYIDEELEAEVDTVVSGAIAAIMEDRRIPSDPSAGRAWAKFNERKDRTQHRRRLFVVKFRPSIPNGGDPWIGESPEPWHPTRPDCWVDTGPWWDNKGDLQQHVQSPDLQHVMPGDLLLVMRLPYEDPKATPPIGRVNDPSPFGGAAKFLGVWWVVARTTRWVADGAKRPSTELWHLPLVRFDDTDVVDVETMRNLDINLRRATPMSTPNWTLVGCKDGNEEALFAAACSLPSDVFTAHDLPAVANMLARKRCGMPSAAKRYHRDMLYRHAIRSLTEETATRRSEAASAPHGWKTYTMEDVRLWGGDFLHIRRNPVDGSLERRCVEVKGTRHDPWEGHVKLEASQRDRATRDATGQPLPHERGVTWELHIQAGIPTTHDPKDDRMLPRLVVQNSTMVNESWREKWVHRRATRNP